MNSSSMRSNVLVIGHGRRRRPVARLESPFTRLWPCNDYRPTLAIGRDDIMRECCRSVQDLTWPSSDVANEIALLTRKMRKRAGHALQVSRPDEQRREAPRMVMAIWVPTWRVQLMQIDVEPATAKDCIASECLANLSPADFFEGEVFPEKSFKHLSSPWLWAA